MDFTTAIRTCFQKYATFSGRAQRSEYWYFVLFVVLGGVVFGLIDAILLGWASNNPQLLGPVFSLATFLPNLAAAVRRLHDTDRSGWWILLVLIPLIGWIVLIVWYSSGGTEGANRFGPDPLDGTSGGGEVFLHRSSIPSVRRRD